MERLSHDLNLALEESNCGKQGRRKFGLRRRTRSAGNIPAACTTGILEDGSSSSPPQPPIVAQQLSDSDDPQLNPLKQPNAKPRASHFCPIGNFESDSFNENFSPTRPPNARRKRKYKKMAIDYADGNRPSSPLEILNVTQMNCMPSLSIHNQGTSPVSQINKKKRIIKADRGNVFCGKRKWSHRERSEIGEMRERSFSGGCSSKSYFFSKNYLEFKNGKKYVIDKVPKFKEKLNAETVPLKVCHDPSLPKLDLSANFSAGTSLAGSSSFNFVYRSPSLKNGSPLFSKVTGFKITTDLPPFFSPSTSDNMSSNTSGISSLGLPDIIHKSQCGRKSKSVNHNKDSLRNPLQFDDSGASMDCGIGNELLSSSSLSSSDSEGVVTNDSDREGDDELTDWPGNDEISTFNKSLNFKTGRPLNNVVASKQGNNGVSNKPMKKEKFLPKHGLSSCKNKSDRNVAKSVELVDISNELQMDDDTMMSDSGSVLDAVDGKVVSKENFKTLPGNSSFTSFSDVINAGAAGQSVNEAFFQSFQAYQEQSTSHVADSTHSYSGTPRTNFSLQKTSSSDLNLSEKSPQSDHYYSEYSLGNFGVNEIREIRAGCRRIRDERPGLVILSAANEQLSKFLQDSCQLELKLPCFQHDPEEREKLESLAKLYSLELQVELGRPILRKTSNTTQAIRVEQSRMHQAKFFSDYKRRCYGDDDDFDNIDSPEHTVIADRGQRHQPYFDDCSNSLTNDSVISDVDLVCNVNQKVESSFPAGLSGNDTLDSRKSLPDIINSTADSFSNSILLNAAVLDPGDID